MSEDIFIKQAIGQYGEYGGRILLHVRTALQKLVKSD